MNCCSQPETPILRGPVPLSHLFLRQFVNCGDHVIDATCGNGHDTLLLAELVGTSGRVWAFDIQEKALQSTSERLSSAGFLERVELILASHETIANRCRGTFRAVTFNLGYLPGGNRDLITRPESTLAALEQSLKILAPSGVIAITIYPGHDGGRLEQITVEEWANELCPSDCFVWRMGQLNVQDTAPYFILIQKAP
jgi:SAM-dependent methyltransferase